MSAHAADLNGDGKLDVVVGRNFDAPIVFLNNGTNDPFAGVAGQDLAPHPQGTQATNPQQAAYIADLNGDQHPDILAVGFNYPTKLYLNNGTANPFAAVVGLDVNPGSTDSSTDAAIADFNGDGLPDLALSTTNHNRSRVFLNTGSSSNPFGGAARLDIGIESAYADHVEAGDINGDGRADVVLQFGGIQVGEPEGVYVYLNNGTNDPFNSVTPKNLADGHSWITKLADVNGDSKLDLIVGGQGDGSFLSINTGSATDPFNSKYPLPQTAPDSGCAAIHTGDVDGNGSVDVMFGCLTGIFSGMNSATLGALFRNNGTAAPFNGVAREDILLGSVPLSMRSLLVTEFVAGRPSMLFGGQLASVYPLIFDRNPVAHDDSGVASVNQFVNADVLTNDTDADGTLDRATLEIVGTPLHGIARVDPNAHTIIFQPDPGFAGADSLSYRVRDELGALSNTATLALRIQAAPVANNDAQSTVGNQSVTIDVLANDTSSGGTLSVATLTITSAPAHGTAAIVAGASSINYQPANGFVGTDTFQYTIRDNLDAISGTATVTVTVTEPPRSRGSGGGGSQSAWLLLALFMLATVRMLRGA